MRAYNATWTPNINTWPQFHLSLVFIEDILPVVGLTQYRPAQSQIDNKTESLQYFILHGLQLVHHYIILCTWLMF